MAQQKGQHLALRLARIFKNILGLCLGLALDLGSGVAWAQDVPAAETALKAQEYDKVIELLGSHVEKLDREGLHLLAEAHSQKGNQMSAIKLYDAALSLNPKDAPSKRKIGLEYLKLKKEKEAMLVFREAIELNPDYEPAYIDLGILLEKREAGKKSKQNRYDIRLLYEDLIKRKAVGRKPEYITKLCELTTLDGQYDLSPKLCEEGIRRKNNDPKNYIYLALTFKETGKTDQARRYFLKAADSFSKSEFAQLSMADFYAEEKNFLKAYGYYKRATEANSESLKGWYGVASASLEIQKTEEAYKALNKACGINRAATIEVRKALKSVNQQKNSEWKAKFDQLLDTCGISKDF